MFRLPMLLAVMGVLLSAPAAFAEDRPGPAMPEKLTVVLDWFVNPDHGPLVLAVQRGMFREAGLAVELIAPSDPNDPPKLVAAGKADLAITYQPQLHLQVAEGLPVARIATLIDTPLSSLMVSADGPVKSLADFKGRKIGYSISGFEDALLRTMLQSAGVKLNDVTLINVNFSLSPALLSGQVDGVIGAFRNFEVNQMALEGHPARAFYPEEAGVPAYDELIVIANRDRLEDPRLARFVAVLERGVLALLNDPDRAWADFIGYQKGLDDDLNRRAWADTLRRFAHNPRALDGERYQRFARFLHANRLITELPPLGRYAVSLGGP
jgi:putative hydroxymethylpyrimidine transport system substrate-binding protein